MKKGKVIKINLQIAPLIDVIFNLLLFFMLTYQLSKDHGIKITLPKAYTAKIQNNNEKIVIFVNEKNEIFLNDREINEQELRYVLEEKLKISHNKTVILKADEKIDLGLAVKIVDIAKQAMAEEVIISTRLQENVK